MVMIDQYFTMNMPQAPPVGPWQILFVQVTKAVAYIGYRKFDTDINLW